MSDDAKQIKAGDHLGQINGAPVKAKVDGEGNVSADVPDPKKPAELSVDEHHAALIQRETVTLVLRARANPLTGYRRGEIRRDVQMQSARCAVAHRVLHGLSPKERELLVEAHKASPHAAADFEKRALRHIEQSLPAELTGPALQKTLAVHAHDKKLAEHRARALAAAKGAPKAEPAPSPAA